MCSSISIGRIQRHLTAWLRDNFRWTGSASFVPPQSGVYEFVLLGACHACFLIDGIAVIHRFDGGSETVCKSVDLEAGRSYRISS